MSAIDEAREAEARMTPGPWHHGSDLWACATTKPNGCGAIVVTAEGQGDVARDNAAGIVAIRNAWTDAMAALDESRREVARLTAALTEARKVAEEAIGTLAHIGRVGGGDWQQTCADDAVDLRARLAATEAK